MSSQSVKLPRPAAHISFFRICVSLTQTCCPSDFTEDVSYIIHAYMEIFGTAVIIFFKENVAAGRLNLGRMFVHKFDSFFE